MALHDASDHEQAEACFREGLDLATSLGDRLLVAGFLENLAALAAAVYPEHAAGWLGAAVGMRKALGSPLPPVERYVHAQTMATVQCALDVDLTVALADGESCQLEVILQDVADLRCRARAEPATGPGLHHSNTRRACQVAHVE
jgi:hypothetical protein